MPPVLTEPDYLAFEVGSADRHELVDGVVRAMTGASIRHNTVAGNLYLALRSAVRGSGCRVTMEGVRLRVNDRRHYYPDVMATCEPVDDPLAFGAPCLVAEVLSPGTELIDRGEKRLVYLSMPGLRHVLLVDHHTEVVEHYERADDGDPWRITVHHPGDVLALRCPVEMTVTVDEILAAD